MTMTAAASARPERGSGMTLTAPELVTVAYTLTFWGTRGSIPTPGPQTARYGGNTACVSITRAAADGW